MSLFDWAKNADGDLEFFYKDTRIFTFPTAGGILKVEGSLYTADGVGAAGDDADSVVEHGSGKRHNTVITFSDTHTLAGANLAVGSHLYTFPAKKILVHGVWISSTLTAATETATPDVGVGTTVGSGAQTVLSGVGAAAENIISGVASSAISAGGTADTSETLASVCPLFLAASAAVYYNMAAGWSASEDLTVSGTARISWEELS